ncbi:CDP-alcohol phosphatidyltransferase family protein [Candidatus Babeliales bacterium]|nr:CDP-alcohol phosphatidyltransferase family protein [Candidatus Babeliales bacterium]
MLKKIILAYKNIHKDKQWFTVANCLTASRILLVPFIVAGIFYQRWYLVFYLFIYVGLSDLLDGFLARLLKENTYLGKILDPIADKILLVSSFSALAFLESPSFLIPKWFVFLVLFREFFILTGSFIMLLLNINFEIAPTIWGKLTTFFQILFILWIFLCGFFEWNPEKTYYIFLTLLALFSVLSLLQYIKIGLNYLINSFNKS